MKGRPRRWPTENSPACEFRELAVPLGPAALGDICYALPSAASARCRVLHVSGYLLDVGSLWSDSWCSLATIGASATLRSSRTSIEMECTGSAMCVDCCDCSSGGVSHRSLGAYDAPTWNGIDQALPRNRPLPSWNIYVLRAMPAKFVGIVDAADADAAIDEAIKEFEIKDPSRQKRGGGA
jgi:hypothetical protein